MPQLSVSSWSLHRNLGNVPFYGPERGGQVGSLPSKPAEFSLLELPARIAAFGITTLDLCHFHLPSCDAGYLHELRTELDRAGVTLWALLVDAGDVTHPQFAQRDLAWIESWIPTAEALGAQTMRVIAGRQDPTPETLQMSLKAFRQLLAKAKQHQVRLVTENWFGLVARPAELLWLLKELDGQLGLKFDFGNWDQPSKYDDLAQIAQFAESSHAKAHFKAAYEMDQADYVRCLDLLRTAQFDGPHTLIYDDREGPDEWRGLQIERDVVQAYL